VLFSCVCGRGHSVIAFLCAQCEGWLETTFVGFYRKVNICVDLTALSRPSFECNVAQSGKKITNISEAEHTFETLSHFHQLTKRKCLSHRNEKDTTRNETWLCLMMAYRQGRNVCHFLRYNKYIFMLHGRKYEVFEFCVLWDITQRRLVSPRVFGPYTHTRKVGAKPPYAAQHSTRRQNSGKPQRKPTIYEIFLDPLQHTEMIFTKVFCELAIEYVNKVHTSLCP
jgi:hypothetical protein